MKSGKPILLVLYVVALILLAILFGLTARPRPYSAWALGLALVSMAGVWLVHGRGPVLLRLGLALVLLMLLAAGMDAITTQPTFAELFGVATLVCGNVTLFAAGLRWRGYTCTAGCLSEAEPIAAPRQFTLAGIFVGLTFVAMVLASARFMGFPWEHLVEVSAQIVTLVLIAWLAHVLAGGGCFLFALLPLTLFAYFASPYSRFVRANVLAPYTLAIVSFYFVLHVAGYRWHWHQRRAGKAGRDVAQETPSS